MKTKPCHLEIVAVLLLSVIPWPGPTVFKISCPRDRASVVRRIVQKRWIPILKKYQVELPLECPFHESRDIFHPQQAAKFQHRTSQWTCGLCGKSFYAEKHLDAHFDSRHKSNVNMAEDAVCLANYCDIMRCDVLGSGDLDSSLIDDTAGSLNTDIQVWRESTQNRRSSSFSSCECRELARVYTNDKSEIAPAVSSYNSNKQRHCKRGGGAFDGGNVVSTSPTDSGHSPVSGSSSSSGTTAGASSTTSTSSQSSYRINTGPDNESTACDNPDGENPAAAAADDDDDDDDDDEASNFVEASLPAAVDKRERSKEFEIRKLKSNCKPEELQKLKLQCEILVRDCIAGLLANLSVKDFQEIEGELNRAICWYLSCDKYWEDSRRQPRHTPWYLLITFLLILSTGISACYYVISMLLNSGDDGGIDSNEENQDFNDGPDRGSGSLLHDPGGDGRLDDHRRRIEIGEDRLVAATGEMPDHYIYVAYPPELKRRLLESGGDRLSSCYNRTTRL